jgi:two-component system nitrate/nitrite response regulator NarL
MSPITIVIADQYKPTRTICLDLLQREKGIRVVGEARNGLEVISTLAKLKPRILLLNSNLLNKRRTSLLQTIHMKSPRTRVILIVRHVSEPIILEALSYGIRGYLREPFIITFLPKTVRAVNTGEAWIPRKMVSKIIDCLTNLTICEE